MSCPLCDVKKVAEERPRQASPGITRKERRREIPDFTFPLPPHRSRSRRRERATHAIPITLRPLGKCRAMRTRELPTHPPFTDTRVRPLTIPHRGFHGPLIVAPIPEKSQKLQFDSRREGGAAPLSYFVIIGSGPVRQTEPARRELAGKLSSTRRGD